MCYSDECTFVMCIEGIDERHERDALAAGESVNQDADTVELVHLQFEFSSNQQGNCGLRIALVVCIPYFRFMKAAAQRGD